MRKTFFEGGLRSVFRLALKFLIFETFKNNGEKLFINNYIINLDILNV